MDSVIIVVMIPAFAAVPVYVFSRMIEESAPWSQGRIFPLLKRKRHINERLLRRQVRRALAVSRMYNNPLQIPHKVLLEEVRRAATSCSALDLLGAVLWALVTVVMLGLVMYRMATMQDHPKLTPADVENIAIILGFLSAGSIAASLVRCSSRDWMRKIADLAAIVQCCDILDLCGRVATGREALLRLEEHCDALCVDIGDFAVSSKVFLNSMRRDSVLRHVALVQQEVMSRSGAVLRDGPTALPGLIQVIGTLLERLIEQRWLGLLDVTATGEAESIARSSVHRNGKRDAWIVIVGSLAAAIAAGAAVAVGLPLTAAIPSALIFLLGPAMLWGSRRLGVSPRIVLDSIRTSVAEGNQSGSSQQSTSAGSGIGVA
ncbi:hypothetical protein [Streptomyces tricolor]|uniref:hypothetical protein n=1 Tax=Streptomyces tricolor TaxID=68277 RepID=UPI0036E45419